MRVSRPYEEMLNRLLDASHTMSMESLPGAVAEHAAAAGMHQVSIHLTDLRQEVLRQLTGRGEDAGQGGEETTALRVEGTLPGRAFQSTRVLTGAGPDGLTRWWVPLLNGTERLGVLRLDTDPDGGPEESQVLRLASLVGLLIVDKRSHSDSYARLVRTQPMTVAAEMQWNLMPPQTFSNGRVTVSAVLEPAYEVGGDAFDYALAGDTVHLAVFDAMGHDTSAGLTANLAVAACRNHRRQGATLVDTGHGIERTLLAQSDETRYVTAILAALDTRTGVLSWTNHGHHPPVVIRGGRWTTTAYCPPSHPLGSDLGLDATLCEEHLQPGDRVVLYTDGITEARGRQGEEFGLDNFVNFLIRHHADGLSVPETLRRLVRGILEHHLERLDDDATVLILQWHGPAARAPHPLTG
ncbi:PP2C family protein-serine/threonine phosphatase [Streptomyces sparsus]